MPSRSRSLLAFGLLATLALAGCGEEDATSVRITLNAQGGGTVLTSAIAQPTTPGPLEAASSGATFTHRGAVNVAKGEFADVSGLKIADLTFALDRGSANTLVVTLPRGSAAQWPALLSIPDGEARKRATAALDSANAASRLGQTAKLEITLPTDVVASGFQGKARGAASSHAENVATLLVPMDVAFESGEPIRWFITWGR